MSGLWQFWIDRGGTFTDIVARDPQGQLSTHKLLSENPGRYADAAIAGIKQALGVALDAPVPSGLIEAVKMGTTVATNALLERAGERVLLIVGRGFADALRIGNQARPRLFDLKITLPSLLYEQVVEIGGRVDVQGREIEALDEEAAVAAFDAARRSGIAAVAIVLMHAWKYPAHEKRLAVLAGEAGFTGEIDWEGARHDHDYAFELARGRGGDDRKANRLVKRWLAKADHLLGHDTHWEAVERIAAELLRVEEISGRAARHLFEM